MSIDEECSLGSAIESAYADWPHKDPLSKDFKTIHDDLKFSLVTPRKNISFVIHTYRPPSGNEEVIVLDIDRNTNYSTLNKRGKGIRSATNNNNFNRTTNGYKINNHDTNNVKATDYSYSRLQSEGVGASKRTLGEKIEWLIQSTRDGSSHRVLPEYKNRSYDDGMFIGPRSSQMQGHGEDTISVKVLKRILWEFGDNTFSRPELSTVLKKLGIPDDDKAVINLNDFIDYCYSIPTSDSGGRRRSDKFGYPFVKTRSEQLSTNGVNNGMVEGSQIQNKSDIHRGVYDRNDHRWFIDSYSSSAGSAKAQFDERPQLSLSDFERTSDTFHRCMLGDTFDRCTSESDSEVYALIQSNVKRKQQDDRLKKKRKIWRGSLESTDTYLLENQRGARIRKVNTDKMRYRTRNSSMPSVCGDNIHLYTKLPRAQEPVAVASSESTLF